MESTTPSIVLGAQPSRRLFTKTYAGWRAASDSALSFEKIAVLDIQKAR
jgi:hypothetical protein